MRGILQTTITNKEKRETFLISVPQFHNVPRSFTVTRQTHTQTQIKKHMGMLNLKFCGVEKREREREERKRAAIVNYFWRPLRSDAVNISSFGMVMVRSFASSAFLSALNSQVLRFAQPLCSSCGKNNKQTNKNKAIEAKDME